ncbi:MAG: YicC family protein [Candidatus Zixiibacteriota bacterium]|nr:MAG: YicC family protein [candidate division Zixibacteria bacterium]
MPRSMTGFGRAEAEYRGNKLTVEINTLNSRYLEYQTRIPKSLTPLENDIKNLLNSRFKRGKIIITITQDQEQPEDSIILDEQKADSYFRIFNLLKEKYSLKPDLSLQDFAALPDLVKIEKEDDNLKEIWDNLQPVVLEAAEAVNRMRIAEGENLARDMVDRLKSIEKYAGEIERLSGENVEEYREKLKAKVAEIVGDSPIDENRLAMEIALFAEKSDITEECIRLRSHVEQFAGSLKESGPVGKRLNFILQELNREANTAGSKSASYPISRRVISIKEEVERLREQIQNIE